MVFLCFIEQPTFDNRFQTNSKLVLKGRRPSVYIIKPAVDLPIQSISHVMNMSSILRVVVAGSLGEVIYNQGGREVTNPEAEGAPKD